MRKKVIKFLLISIAVLPPLFFLNTGFGRIFSFEGYQTIAFAFALGSFLVWPALRRYGLYASLILIILMVAAQITGFLNLSNIAGSTAFGLVLMLILGGLGEFIAKAHIAKF